MKSIHVYMLWPFCCILLQQTPKFKWKFTIDLKSICNALLFFGGNGLEVNSSLSFVRMVAYSTSWRCHIVLCGGPVLSCILHLQYILQQQQQHKPTVRPGPSSDHVNSTYFYRFQTINFRARHVELVAWKSSHIHWSVHFGLAKLRVYNLYLRISLWNPTKIITIHVVQLQWKIWIGLFIHCSQTL